MNINTDVYGAASSWYYPPCFGSNMQTFFANNYALLNAFKAKPPKCANFGGTDDDAKGRFTRGIAEGKTPQNMPIDNSINPIGQDPAVSPFGKMKCVKVVSRSGWTPTRAISDIINDKPINTFIAGYMGSTNSYNNLRGWKHNVGYDRNSIWSPESNMTDNPNGYIYPITENGSKAILLTPLVWVSSSEIGGAQNGSWQTLDAWKNTYNTLYAYAIALQVKIVTGVTATNITYGTNQTSTLFQRFTCALYDAITDPDEEFIDYSFLLDTLSGRGDLIMLMRYNDYNETIQQNVVGVHWHMYFPNVDLLDNCTFQQDWSLSTRAVEHIRWGYKIGYSDNNYNVIMKWASMFGMPFSPTSQSSFATTFDDTNLYFPIIDDNGITHGEYTHGAGNLTNPFNDTSSTRDYDYDPTGPVDPNTYSLTTHFNTIDSVASTTKQYVINGDGLRGLSGEMWAIMSDLIVNPEDVENLSNLSLDAFLTNNPIDAIVSVKKFPLDHVPHGETLENVYLGKYQTSAGAYELATQQAQYNFTAIPVYPKFGGCFLDYAPYTTMQLYIPFCGTIEIDPADFMGRNLSVEMNMDFITGTVTAYVLSNELVIQTATGQCAIDVPITGTESATVDAAYQSAVINERQARNKYYQAGLGVLKHPIKTFLSPVSTTLKTISTAQSWAQTEYELTHIQEPLRQIGAASPLNSWALEFVCRLIIYYPDGEIITFNANNEPALITDKVKAFGDVNGFATVETGTLSNFEGFTQVSSVDLDNVKATQNELEMIRNLLQGGVYL